MKSFRCMLINNGVIVKQFIRKGKDAISVKTGLEFFQWPKGKWRVECID